MSNVLSSLPAVYRGLLSPLLARSIPTETKATCADCAMCNKATLLPSSDGTSKLFNPSTKCCTYHPRLPNYLVGSLLSDDNAEEGKRRVRERIASRIGVSPQWLRPPAKYSLVYDQVRGGFGRSEALLCPYYDDGACTVWAHREAVCSTYFCRYEKGEDGHAMWMQLKSYLALCELQLTRHALWTLMPEYVMQKHDVADPPQLTGSELDSLPSPEHEKLWGEWAGREEAFYLRCHQTIASLNAADVERILGIDGQVTLAILERRYDAAINDVLPMTLRFNPNATVQWLPDNVLALGAYSNLDALTIDGSAYAMLVQFDGTKPVAEVRSLLRREKQSDLSDEVLLSLYRHRILTV